MRIKNAGVVEEDVEVFEGAHRFLDCTPAFVSLANVGAQEDGFAAVFQDLLGHGMATLCSSCGTAPFEAQSTAGLGPPARPQLEAVLMIGPPSLFSITGIV